MRTLVLSLILAFSVTVLLAQTSSQPSSAPTTPMHHNMMTMHQHMQSMQDQATSMRATLEKMKGNLAKITDPSLKQQAQYDVDLWEAMVQHMEGMSKMMDAHQSMGMDHMKNHPMAPDSTPKK
jgi:hypothetical protein